ncbi:melanopsin-like [Orbicella faveolata]|uniref:melanopsin-like n=1 Tax=Orbicella faveolata TaxID=48498 RepID=UPI0009E1F8AB|nr:melanopsin-like [Orbicella faveolata]
MVITEKWSTIFVVIELVVCFLGIAFNGVVIFTICNCRNVRRRISAPTYLILSIAVSDFLSCAIPVPLSIARHFQKEWPFGLAGCQAHAFMIFLLALVSITHLVAISAGKYLTITKSLSRDSYFNKKKVVLIILGSWIYSLAFSVAPLVSWSRYGLEGKNATCSVRWDSSLSSDQAYFGVVIFTCYVLPLAVITFCYYKIHQVSKQIVVNTSHSGGLTMTATQALLRKHQKTAVYFLAIIAGFLIPWSPYAAVSLLLVVGRKVSPFATSACSVLAKISFFLNPLLYAIFNRKFRRRFILSVPISRLNEVIRPAVVPSVSRTLAL